MIPCKKVARQLSVKNVGRRARVRQEVAFAFISIAPKVSRHNLWLMHEQAVKRCGHTGCLPACLGGWVVGWLVGWLALSGAANSCPDGI